MRRWGRVAWRGWTASPCYRSPLPRASAGYVVIVIMIIITVTITAIDYDSNCYHGIMTIIIIRPWPGARPSAPIIILLIILIII